MTMDEGKARQILSGDIQPDGNLFNLGWYLDWEVGDANATLDGKFSADDLEAIAWWMRNTQGKEVE